jgi:acyl-CoA thioesterase
MSKEHNIPQRVVEKMYSEDYFSQWLGIKVVAIRQAYCLLQLTIVKQMLNGFGIAHGGISYSLADSALAFASNSYGIQSVSIETSISHTAPLKEGDVINAEATEVSRTNKIAIYNVHVYNHLNKTVALFKGTVYITHKEWFQKI